MGKIFCLMGKSSSGKDTIYKYLIADQELRLKRIVPYTTRPIRQGEQEGVEYHFVNAEQMFEYEKSGQMIEKRAYETVHGTWYYFTVCEKQMNLETEDYLVIRTLESWRSMCRHFGRDKVIPVYIEVKNSIRRKRAIAREKEQKVPDYPEMRRRYRADGKDFSEKILTEEGIVKRFQNENLEMCLREIKLFIQSEMRYN